MGCRRHGEAGIWADVPSADAVIDRPGQSIPLHSRLLPAIMTALPEPATVGKVVSQTVSSKLHKGKPGSHRIHTGRTVLLVTPVSYLPVVWGVVETYSH